MPAKDARKKGFAFYLYELTARQALKIESMERAMKGYRKMVDDIQMVLYCVGGPLNDNVLDFNKEQRKLLHEIADLARHQENHLGDTTDMVEENDL